VAPVTIEASTEVQMLTTALIHPVFWYSWVDAALWDLLGLALWGSLLASGVLTIVGLLRRSPWNLLLAAVLSLGFCGLAAYMYASWMLVVPIAQVAMATMIIAIRQLDRA
jgi:hypothetical protein